MNQEVSSEICVAAIQCSLSGSVSENVDRIVAHVRSAASLGAQLVVPPELFEGPYFCKQEEEDYFSWAKPADNHPTIVALSKVAKELKVAIPVSFFERANQAFYNSVAMVDADGEILGIYRKSHIPDGPGYEEKFYFRPGDTGFRVWNTKYARVGVGICWDQWFPECARALTLQGAEVLCYPTAIGSEPHDPMLDTRDPWQRAMIGHAVSNVIPVVASNRIGNEDGQMFYGSSFVCNERGDKVAELNRGEEGVIFARFDRQQLLKTRAAWGFFRDRRPELYKVLTTADGCLVPEPRDR
jgi:N-carbamoylputrescine amidase